jgi:putative flippase GtrA
MDVKKIVAGKTDNTFIQFFRYIFVGGGATVVQYLLLLIFREAFGFNANVANAVGFAGGLACNYLISTYWVFNASSVKNKAAEISAFALIGIVGFGINQGLIALFDNTLADKKIFGSLISTHWYYMVGQVLATGITFFWNFFARKYLLYNKSTEDKKSKKEDSLDSAESLEKI